MRVLSALLVAASAATVGCGSGGNEKAVAPEKFHLKPDRPPTGGMDPGPAAGPKLPKGKAGDSGATTQ